MERKPHAVATDVQPFNNEAVKGTSVMRNEGGAASFAGKGDIREDARGAVKIDARGSMELDVLHDDVLITFTHDAALTAHLAPHVQKLEAGREIV